MSDRLRQVKDRIATVVQLEAVITAMRGIAAAHLREANEQLLGVRSYAATIAATIGEALAFLPDSATREDSQKWTESQLVIVVSAEQGFAGPFNEHIIDFMAQHAALSQHQGIILVGSRGMSIARERGVIVVDRYAMATHPRAVQGLAIKLADAIYKQVNAKRFANVRLVHTERYLTGDLTICDRSLIPFDFTRFPIPARAVPPLLTLEPEILLQHLAEEYVYAELYEMLMLSLAAENEARVRAMIRARSNVLNTRTELRTTFQQLRQDQITAEISELATGRIAGKRSAQNR
jgi:F-type H+-transporting ATPase subunit gamma